MVWGGIGEGDYDVRTAMCSTRGPADWATAHVACIHKRGPAHVNVHVS